MPIYEYRCSDCGHELEALQKLADAPLRACPQCGKETLSKLISAAGFQLKGSGWYATDFRNSGAKPAAKDASNSKTEGGESKPGAEAAPTAKAESKAETKAATDAPAAKPSPAGTTPAST